MPKKARAELLDKLDDPPWLLDEPSGERPRPPVRTRHQHLPFSGLTWQNFERLCLRLASTEGDAEHWQLFGSEGQEQGGIDIFVRRRGSTKYAVWQSKRYRSFGPAQIDSAVEKFCGGEWLAKADQFILCASADFRSTDIANALESCAQRLRSAGVELIPMDAERLSHALKQHPKIVDDFFGRAWVDCFCGPEVAKALAVLPESSKTSVECEQSVAIDDNKIFRRLSLITKRTSARANVIQAGDDVATVRLGTNVYVKRDIEEDILGLLATDELQWELVVIEGEPGTGKSSLLWSIQRRLVDEFHLDAWLVDAAEMSSVFGQRSNDGTILSPEFSRLLQQMAAARRSPVVLIDTVDVGLNVKERENYLITLLSELAENGAIVAVASRPGEARKLDDLEPKPKIIHLFEYSESEFPIAVEHYARAFVRDGSAIGPEEHARQLLEAAAQGYPIREICRNPLTLRMLYSIYAPQQINFVDIDVVSLYRAFWTRRVEADIRTDAPSVPASDKDLSQCAMQVATCMLVEGVPELSQSLLNRELDSVGSTKEELSLLAARGVVRIGRSGRENSISFFHQTFFEHAAALAILRLGGVKAMRALAERWIAGEDNLFIGSVLERVLVLAEDETFPVRQEANAILSGLQSRGASALSLLVYAFVHRRSVPSGLEQGLRDSITRGQNLVTERLLGIAANAAPMRRPGLIGTIALIFASDKGRWSRRALELILRFASPDMAAISGLLGSANIGDTIAKQSENVPQLRELYLKFLGQYFSKQPRWVLTELVKIFAAAIRHRSAERPAVQALEIIGDNFPGTQGVDVLSMLESAAGLRSRGSRVVLRSETVTEKIGNLYYLAWKRENICPTRVIEDLATAGHASFVLHARLNGLARLLTDSAPGIVVAAFDQTARMPQRGLRIMLAMSTWAGVLGNIERAWNGEDANVVAEQIREWSGDLLSANRNVHADTLIHSVRCSTLSRGFLDRFLGQNVASERSMWLDVSLLGNRIVEGVFAEIRGARAAFEQMLGEPAKYTSLARAVLAQLKSVGLGDRAIEMGLAVATQTSNTDAVIEFLEAATEAKSSWGPYVAPMQETIERLRATGNTRTRRQAIRIEVELLRLDLLPALDWEIVSRHAERERDDLNRSHIVKGLGHIIRRLTNGIHPRLAWLISLAKGSGPETRRAALEIFSRLCDEQPSIASGYIEELFLLAFEGSPDGNMIETLANPLFALYSLNEPRTTHFAESLIINCTRLPMQTCRNVYGRFRRLFGIIMRRMDQGMRDRLLGMVPGLNRYLARMILEGVASPAIGLGAKLRQIGEDPSTEPEIVSFVAKLLRVEQRTSDLGRWPELYQWTRPLQSNLAV
jgi:hypothetical protein